MRTRFRLNERVCLGYPAEGCLYTRHQQRKNRGTDESRSPWKIKKHYLQGAIRMTKNDFIPYWEHYVSQTDILQMYQAMGRTLNARNQGKCVRCGNDTLYLNREWQGFRCFNPACNDHGDVVRLIQRSEVYGFPMAFGILDGGRWTEWWSKEDLEQFGAVRDCMTVAAIFFC